MSANDEQKKKYLTPMTEEPLYCVSNKLSLTAVVQEIMSVPELSND